jgi:hypothetical protein
MMRLPDPSLTEQLLESGVIRDREELHEVLQEAAWLAHQADLTAQLPLENEELSGPPALETAP